MKIDLTPEWRAVGLALNGAGAAVAIGRAPNGDVIGHCYVNNVAVATVPGKDVAMLFRNLAVLVEQTR